eukprot:2139315-Prymnesium_polylepis.1
MHWSETAVAGALMYFRPGPGKVRAHAPRFSTNGAQGHAGPCCLPLRLQPGHLHLRICLRRQPRRGVRLCGAHAREPPLLIAMLAAPPPPP